MRVPEWLLNLLDKCLEKKPENRFRNGLELHDYIIHYSTHAAINEIDATADADLPDVQKLSRERDQYYQQLVQYRQQLAQKEKEINQLKAEKNTGNAPLAKDTAALYETREKKGVSVNSFVVLLLLTIGLAAFSAYSYIKNSKSNNLEATTKESQNAIDDTLDVAVEKKPLVEKKKDTVSMREKLVKPVVKKDSAIRITENAVEENATKPENNENTLNEIIVPDPTTETTQVAQEAQYKVVVKAYFYSSPDETTRRNAYMVPSDNAVLNAQDEQNGFVYVVFTNQLGKTSRGWLQKKDLKSIE